MDIFFKVKDGHMKKILLVILLLLMVTLTGCKKEKVALEDIYGKYDFIECVYVNRQNPMQKVLINEMFQNKARYSIKESSFAFYETDDTIPSISLKSISYRETEINDGIEDAEIQKLFKKATTRYDIYKLEVSQGYSLVFTNEEIYFVEYRRLSTETRVVWSIFEIEKRD